MRQVCPKTTDRPQRAAPQARLGWSCVCLWAAALLLAGCEAPDVTYGSCVASCSADADCRNEMSCNVEGLCVARRDMTCGTSVGSGSAGGNANAGGTLSEGGGTRAAGTSAGAGGTGEATGAGGAIVSGPSGGAGFTGTGGVVTGSGGAIVSGPSGGAGFTGTGGVVTGSGGAKGGATSTGGALVTGGLTSTAGTPNGGGNAGAVGSSTGGVAGADAGTTGGCEPGNTPSITTQSFVPACLGQVYEARLTATNGANYAWSAEVPADLGLTLSNSGVLAGVIRRPGSFPIGVSVADQSSGCTSAPRQLTLTVNDTTNTECPTIHLKDKLASALAPDSCKAWPYSAEFEVAGPNPPYTWQAVSAPPGMTFDSTTQRAGGSPTDSGDLVLQVTDQSGLATQRSFTVRHREKCWFAYISEESGAVRLHLVDPLLSARLQRPTSNATDVSVVDYKFSPDGKYIAYRVEDANEHRTLWLWKSPEWTREQAIELGGSVSRYEWSGNGQVLAVAFEGSSGTQLGGVDVSQVPEVQLVEGGIHGLRLLQPVAAPVTSDIIWYGDDKGIAFSWHDPYYKVNFLGQGTYGSSGFIDVNADGLMLDPSVLIYPSTIGYFTTVTANGQLYFFRDNPMAPITHGNVAIAPDGTLVALSSGNRLDLYRPTDSTNAPSVPAYASAAGCDTILGWAPDPARVVCVDQSLLRLHTIDPTQQTVTSAPISNSNAYVQDEWREHPRVVDRAGNRLVLSTGTSLYLADLEPSAPAILWSKALGTSTAQLSFSPNGRYLAVGTGSSSLLLFVTESDGTYSPHTNLLSSGHTCQDDRLSTPDWCGADRRPTGLVWSSDSELLAFVQDDRQLIASRFDEARGVQRIDNTRILETCSDTCAGTARFQP